MSMLRATIKDGRTGEVISGLENVALDNAQVVKLGVPSEPGIYPRHFGSGKQAERYMVVVMEVKS